jgi:hypothetical protein
VNRLTLEAAKRARTWNLAIAAVILGGDVPYQDIGHDRHWDGLGGFSVDHRDGAWYCFGTEEGGYSSRKLVHFLLRGGSWTDSDTWLQSFLNTHQARSLST